MKTNARLYSVLNCTVHVSVCRRFVCQRFFFGWLIFWYFDVLVWFGLSTFWSVDVLVCRRFGLLMFWSVDISVCQCFGLTTFRFVNVLTSYLQKGPLWLTKSCLWIWSSFCRRHIRMDFFNDIFHNLALLEFSFLILIYTLLYIDFILSIFFQHSNILTRASHHWCLASNIVLVSQQRFRQWLFATRHLRQFWSGAMLPCGITKAQWVKKSKWIITIFESW